MKVDIFILSDRIRGEFHHLITEIRQNRKMYDYSTSDYYMYSFMLEGAYHFSFRLNDVIKNEYKKSQFVDIYSLKQKIGESLTLLMHEIRHEAQKYNRKSKDYVRCDYMIRGAYHFFFCVISLINKKLEGGK